MPTDNTTGMVWDTINTWLANSFDLEKFRENIHQVE